MGSIYAKILRRLSSLVVYPLALGLLAGCFEEGTNSLFPGFARSSSGSSNDSVPTITSISPTSGTLSGGITVTIVGTGFYTGAVVSLGGSTCLSPTITATQITCRVPSRATSGAVDLIVTNANSLASTTTNAFTYIDPPLISSFTPTVGTSAGGTSITITGTGFTAGAAITVGGVSCSSPTISSTSISCTTGAHAAGGVTVTVTNTDSQSSSQSGFTYVTQPTITSVSPTTGPTAGNTLIGITGTGFQAGATVSVGGASCATLLVSWTQINCTTAANSAGSKNVVVTNTDSTTVTSTSAFTYLAPPSVTSLTPSASATAGGGFVTISGSGFVAGATVSIGGNPCTSPAVAATSISCTVPAHAAGTVSVVVTNPDAQTSTLSNSFNYEVTPSISTVSPTSGPPAGGNTLTLTGTAFATGMTVTIGGNPCTSVSVSSSTTLTCTAPAHAAGTVDAVVTNSISQSATGTNLYTFRGTPTLSSISPTGGPLGGGATVTLTGTNFLAGATVSIGGNACTSVNVTSATTLTCSTAAHAAGAVSVTVTNPDAQSATQNNLYTYQDGPTLSSISPSAGNTAGGTTVTLTGTGFLTGATVAFGGTACTAVNVVSATSLTCVTPAKSAGSVSVSVTNTDAQLVNQSSFYTYQGPPTVTAISPNGGPIAGGTAITLTGTNFLSGATVSLGGSSCGSVSVTSSTSLSCTTTAHLAGLIDLVVTNTDTQSVTKNNYFTYQGAPTVTAVSPTAGTLAGGTSVTLTGTNFLSGATVTLGGNPCTSVNVASATSLTCTTAVHVAGTVSITVTNTDTQSGTGSNLYTYQAGPAVTAVSPVAGALGGGTAVTITGSGFLTGATVAFGGTACTSVNVASSTSITCSTPAKTAGAVNVAVTNLDTQVGTLASGYTYQAAPTISTISPSGGNAVGGNSVTITGTGFLNGLTVTIGGNTCTGLNVASATSLSCTVAAHAAGAVDVVVTNPDTQAVTSTNGYTFRAAPTVSSASPNGGLPAGSTNITITGTGFVTGATVTVGGSACSSVNVASATAITCATPAHAAGLVDIIVTNTDNQTGTGSNVFTYRPAPTLTAISPNGGLAAGGTAVTLTGTGFISGATVSIGGNACTSVNVASATSLTCTTPAGVNGAANVVVTNTDTQSVTQNSFFTYRDAPTITGVSPSTGFLAGGLTLTITGTGFISGATVTIGGTACTSVNVASLTSLTCTNPQSTVGAKTVVVTNSDTQTASSVGAFTYSIDGFTKAESFYGVVHPLGSLDGTIPNVRLSDVRGQAYDATNGILYFHDGANCTIRKWVISTGVVSTLTGLVGTCSKIDGNSSTATLGAYGHLTLNSTRTTLYMGDYNNQVIRSINVSTGQVTTIAGSSGGYIDDFGTSAKFFNPAGVALDSTDSYLFVADRVNKVIRKIDLTNSNNVSTLAGTQGAGGSTDGLGAAARFSQPYGMVSDGTYLYVVEQTTCLIRKVKMSDGDTTTLTGTASSCATWDGTSSTGRLSPTGFIAISPDKTTLYTSENYAVRQITIATGDITTIAGGTAAGHEDGTLSKFDTTSGMSSTGTYLYVSDANNNAIRRVDLSSRNVTTSIGTSNSKGYAEGSQSTARMDGIVDMTILGGYLYFAEYNNRTVRRIDLTTYQSSLVAGTPRATGGADGTTYSGTMDSPYSLANDGTNLYVGEDGSYLLRKIASGYLSTVAGVYNSSAAVDGTGTAAKFLLLRGIVPDGSGNLFIGDGAQVRKVVISTGAVSLLAGSTGGFANGVGAAAQFSSLGGGVYDSGNLYFADRNGNCIRKVVVSTATASVFAGQASCSATGSYVDATGTNVRFKSPRGVTSDGTYLYVADNGNHAIRKVRISDGLTSTVVGGPTIPYDSTTGGDLASIGIRGPTHVLWHASGLYISNGYRIWRLY